MQQRKVRMLVLQVVFEFKALPTEKNLYGKCGSKQLRSELSIIVLSIHAYILLWLHYYDICIFCKIQVPLVYTIICN